ncbi:uncharacterized protein LOC110675430 [Aedes aegypti]|uniref:Uncharacterized protein n=1 Tax=Aedes aegypti TaxID=7159 RepID=A0A6I8TYH1_AEDAE|nr:uncharacterized protein LOC110675430 [Aedes aegypti]
MQFSQEEVIESSQKSSRGKCRRRSHISFTQARRSLRSSKVQIAPRRHSSTGEGFEIPERATEDSAGNVSGSLFSGQQDLLKLYDEHERKREDDKVLERVLEQSRKACEQLKLQTESVNLFSATDGIPLRREIGMNTDVIARGEMAIQTTSTERRDFGVQAATEKVVLKHVGVQLSPIVEKRSTRDAEVQSSFPTEESKRMRMTDAGTNTRSVSLEDATVQTNPVERRNVGVQKYHSTRVREVGNQTSAGDLNRSVGKRNVCVQQRSSGMLELNREASLALGIELKCDPTRLQRLLMRVAAKQCSKDGGGNGNDSGEQQVDFTDEDPYLANYGYFMEDLGEEDDGSSPSDSGLGEIEPRMSCSIEESPC